MSSNEVSNPYSLNEQDLRERLRHKKHGRVGAQMFVGLLVCMSAISLGTALAYSNPITYFLEYRRERGMKSALFVSMVPLGCASGVVTWTYAKKHLGPKRCLLAQAPFYVLTWGIMLIKDMTTLIACRYFLGLFAIAHLVCAETLLFQTIHNDLKGYISVGYYSSIMIGVATTQILGYNMTNIHLTFFCMCIPVVQFFLLFIIPESPVYLYDRNHRDAENALIWYRGAENVYLEMRNIRKDWELTRIDPEAYKYMLWSKVVIKAVLIVLVVTALQVCTGYYMFMFYSIRVWNNQQVIMTPIIDCSIISTYFVSSKVFWRTMHSRKYFAVRKVLLLSCLTTALVLTLLAIFLFLHKKGVHQVARHTWIPLVCVALIIFCHDMGLDIYPKMLVLQYVPFQVSNRAYTINSVFFWSLVWLNTFLFGLVKGYAPSYVLFFSFAATMYLGTLFVYFFVVEPKGKSLVQIQVEIGGNPVGNRGAIYLRSNNPQRDTRLQEA